MAKNKNKRRELFSFIWKNKMGAIHIPIMLVVAVLVILFVIVLVKAPEICIPFTEKCWRLVPLKLSKGFMFWNTFAGLIILQIGLIWIYWQIVSKSYHYGRQIIPKMKEWTFNMQKYILTHHG